MAIIETYATEADAVGARDDYNHNIEGKRAAVFKMPGSNVEDYGGGAGSTVLRQTLPQLFGWWLLRILYSQNFRVLNLKKGRLTLSKAAFFLMSQCFTRL
ncbi:MAG: hypothetical protein JKY57_04325 [Kordiimonadaceae bacterium]|nr:hypothetical protein [Kordiimonadaceae bacterium]